MRNSALVALAIATACASAHRTDGAPRGEPTARAATAAVEEPRVAPAPDPAPPPAPPPWTGARELASNGGAYLVRWIPTPAEIPRGPLFAIDAWVFDARDREHALADVDLVVDAAMPEHLHGMNRVPAIAKQGGGFHVEGMKLHMPGNWELYFDVVRGAIAERAQVRIELE